MRLPRHFAPRNDNQGAIYTPFIDEHVIFALLAMTIISYEIAKPIPSKASGSHNSSQ